MIALTDEVNKSYHEQKVCYICKRKFNTYNQKYYKVRDSCHYTRKYRGATHDTCNLNYRAPKKIIFRNSSTDDYNFIIKENVEQFPGELKCLGENIKNI